MEFLEDSIALRSTLIILRAFLIQPFTSSFFIPIYFVLASMEYTHNECPPWIKGENMSKERESILVKGII
jgi:hypothetical protein